jgi:2-dehydro-3-deoxyphosphogluconate aldolase/(4S)-4-hydroxy-2-oxoglutarate aldolase
VKVFPAAQLGGPAYIKAIKGPCPWLSIVVTGGVKANPEDLKAWHDAGAEGFGLGSDMITKDLVKSGNFDALTEKAAELSAFIRQLKT